MGRRGFTLLELAVALAVACILAALATLNFGEYQRRYGVEMQTRRMLADFLAARQSAFIQHRTVRVKVYARRLEVYSSAVDGVSPIVRRDLGYPLVWNNPARDGDPAAVTDFDGKGTTAARRSICVDGDGAGAGFDSLVVSPTRIGIGRRIQGAECDAEHITKR